MFLAPMAASKVAIWTSLRTSQIASGFVMGLTLIPVLLFLLPTTHSVPRLASARLRPQVKTCLLIKLNRVLGLLANDYTQSSFA